MFTCSQRQRLVAESEAASVHHHFGVRGRHRKLDPANDRDEVQGQAGVSLRFRLNGAHRLTVSFEEQLDAVFAQGRELYADRRGAAEFAVNADVGPRGRSADIDGSVRHHQFDGGVCLH